MTQDGKDHADVRILPPVLLLLHLVVAFVLNWLLPLPLPANRTVSTLGFLIVLAGVGLGFSAVFLLLKARTTLEPHGSTTAIVTGGPYRFTRNPIYLGYLCALVGIPLALGNYWGLILAPLMIILSQRLVIRYEEAYLETKFGSEYQAYKSRVRRWL